MVTLIIYIMVSVKTSFDFLNLHECPILLASLNDEFNKLKISQYPNNNKLFKLKTQLSYTVHFLKKINNTKVANTLHYTQNLKNNRNVDFQNLCACAILLRSLNDEFNKLKILQDQNNNMFIKFKKTLSYTVHFLKKINNTNIAITMPYTQNLKNKSKKYQCSCNNVEKWIGYICGLIFGSMLVWIILLLIFNMMTFIFSFF